jgi:thiamine pyrophosphate-dependent acetolactate synthase large subunit-like protein
MGYSESHQSNSRFYSAERLRPIAKSVERLRSAADVNNVMRRAFSRLKNGRPGPVVVEVPVDIASEHIENPEVYEPASHSRPAGDPRAIQQAIQAIATARAPVIWAGQGILYADASEELLAFAEGLRIPVATTIEGKSAFPEDHKLSLGAAGRTMPKPLRDLVATADLIIAIGAGLTDHPLMYRPPPGKRLIHITIDESDINKDYRCEVPIIGDAKLVLSAMLEAAADLQVNRDRGVEGIGARLSNLRKQWLEQWSGSLTSNRRPIDPYRVIWEVRQLLDPASSIVTHDSGSPRDQIVPFYQSVAPHGYIGWGKSHALGSGLGLIMGAKLAAPEKTCVQVMGDAAFGMVGLDFETAVRNKIGVVVVIMNNGTMACETQHLAVAHERYGSRNIGGEYANIASNMGGWARKIEDPDHIASAMKEAVREAGEGRPALLEVITSPEMSRFSCMRGVE